MRLGDLDALMHRFMDKPPEYYHTSYIVGEINTAPTIDVAPVVHGRWVDPEPEGCMGWDKQVFAQCSNCGKKQFYARVDNLRFCPHCGAMMGKDEVRE